MSASVHPTVTAKYACGRAGCLSRVLLPRRPQWEAWRSRSVGPWARARSMPSCAGRSSRPACSIEPMAYYAWRSCAVVSAAGSRHRPGVPAARRSPLVARREQRPDRLRQRPGRAHRSRRRPSGRLQEPARANCALGSVCWSLSWASASGTGRIATTATTPAPTTPPPIRTCSGRVWWRTTDEALHSRDRNRMRLADRLPGHAGAAVYARSWPFAFRVEGWQFTPCHRLRGRRAELELGS